MTTFQRAMIEEAQHRAQLRREGWTRCPTCDGMGFLMSRYTYKSSDCPRCKGFRMIPPAPSESDTP